MNVVIENDPVSTEIPAVAPEPASKRLLIVEGSGFMRVLLVRWFCTVGFRVDFTSNGELGLHKLLSNEPDALIMDVKQRGISGVDLIAQARRDPKFGDRPIYVYACVDDLNRGTKKELERARVKVFDRRSLPVEMFVARVLQDLIPAEQPVEEAIANLTSAPSTAISKAPAASSEAPGTLLQALDEVCSQAEMVLSCQEPVTLLASCGVLRNKVRSLTHRATSEGRHGTAQQAKAIDQLLSQVCKQPEEITSSVLQTISESVEVLGELRNQNPAEEDPDRNFNVVVVHSSSSTDQEFLEALHNAGMHPIVFDKPEAARAHLARHQADLIISGVVHPELHSLDEASIHALARNEQTPVITLPLTHNPNPSRGADSSMPSEQTKPVEIMEFVVKAMNLLRRSKSETRSTSNSTPGQDLAATHPEAKPENRLPQETPSRTAPATAPQPAIPFDPSSAAAQPAGQNSSQLESATSEEPLILFVDDDPFVIKLYRRRLKREGFRVEVAEDGEAAMAKLKQTKPALVLLDLMLPKVSGQDILKFIRSDAELKDTPVLVLSNAFMDKQASQAMSAGATRGILKPECSPTKLVELVTELLGNSLVNAGAPRPVFAVTSNTSTFGETAVWIKENDPVHRAPVEIPKIRRACLDFIKAAGTEDSVLHLEKLYRGVRSLSARSGLTGMTKVCEVASALEALLFEVLFQSSSATPSAFQTIALAVDCLDRLLKSGDTKFPEPRLKPRVLVVDDDAVCTFTSTGILKRARFDATGLQDPKASIRLLQTQTFDLIILDIDMPEMNGFQVCEELRRMPQHKTVPVMFVTMTGEFQSRARGILAGGNDLVTKPVSPMELVLKSTLHVVSSPSNKLATNRRAASTPSEFFSSEAVSKAEQVKPEGEFVPGVSLAGNRPTDPAGSPLQNNPTLGHRLNSPSISMPTPPGMEANLPTDQEEKATDAPVDQDEETSVETLDTQAPETTEQDQPELGPVEELRQQLAKQREVIGKHERERETLVARIYTSESDLCREQSRVKRRDKAIEALQREIDSLKSSDTSSSAAKADSTGPASQQVVPTEQVSSLEQAKTELEKQLTEATQLSGSLRQQLDSVTTAQKQAQERCTQLEQELEGLRKARQELDTKLSTEQKASADSVKRLQDLEQKLTQKTTELQKAAATLESQSKDRTELEAALRKQLDSTTAAQKQAQERCTKLEQELEGLRKARQELDTKLSAEQKASADFAKRLQNLEQQLTQKTAELQKAATTLESQSKDRTNLETTLRKQLDTTTAAQKQAQERCTQLEQDLEALRKTRQELDTKLSTEQKASADFAKRLQTLEQQLTQKTAELQKATTTLESQSKDRTNLETTLRKQLDTTTAAQKQAQERCTQLEQELEGLRKARQELDTKLSTEQKASADFAKRLQSLEQQLTQKTAELQKAATTLESQSKDRTDLETTLRKQLDTTTAAQKQAQERCTQLEQELEGLRKARQELDTKLSTEQKASADFAKRLQNLEQQLSQKTAELQKAATTLESQSKDRTDLETTLRKQLDTTTAAQKQAQERCTQLEQELGNLRQARQELDTKLSTEQKTSADFAKRLQSLEQQLSQKTAELQKAATTLESQSKDRTDLETTLRKQLDTTTAAQKQAQERCTQLEQELGNLRQARQELDTKLSTEQKTSADFAKRLQSLEQQLSQKTAELQKAATTLESQSKNRTDLETTLRKQLDTTTAAQKQAQERCTQLEQELGNLRQARQELDTKLSTEQKTSADSAKRLQNLEQQLSQKTAELQKAATTLESQSKDRTDLETTLRKQLDTTTAAQKQAQERCTQLELELEGLRKLARNSTRSSAPSRKPVLISPNVSRAWNSN